ncbi:hypothetical protein ElyMa_005378400 [Elysia marginata]|uniref:Uncharacterized protein n=1 Tax=Elysia marginata TaxID=1093978 RepID=A0AAV4EDK6_9GAST|nr:hypothetical protein ElyMa_005378400 [Elysia marginata]
MQSWCEMERGAALNVRYVMKGKLQNMSWVLVKCKPAFSQDHLHVGPNSRHIRMHVVQELSPAKSTVEGQPISCKRVFRPESVAENGTAGRPNKRPTGWERR